MDLFFASGSSNTLRDRTTGILSDLLSETIERMRAKTGDKMLDVANALQVNRHNPLLHNIPLKDASDEPQSNGLSRKRKRRCRPDNVAAEPAAATVQTVVTNGHCTELTNGHGETNGHVDPSVVYVEAGQKSVHPKNNKLNRKDSRVSKRGTENGKSDSNSVEKGESGKAKPTETVVNGLSEHKPCKTDQLPDTKKSGKSSGWAKPSVPQTSKLAVPPPVDSKQKKKRKTFKELHKSCDRQFIKLEDVVFTDPPLVLDDDEDEDDALISLIESTCPDNWVCGKPRTPLLRKKSFCRRCIFQEK